MLHIITYNGYASLIEDSKVTVMLDQLWQGRLTYNCDGRTSDFSKLTVMLTDPVRKLPNQKIAFKKILGEGKNKFRRNVQKESYSE